MGWGHAGSRQNTKRKQTEMDESMIHSLQSNIDNPLAQKRDDHTSNPMHTGGERDTEALAAQEETIKAQQEEIMRLKKENQAKMLSTFSSSSKKLKSKSKRGKGKKTFDAGGGQRAGDEIVMRSERHDSRADDGDKELML